MAKGGRRENGVGTAPRLRGDGKTYQIDITINGKRKSIYAPTATECTKKARKALADADNHCYIEPSRITVSQWLCEWMDVYVRNVRRQYTIDEYNSKIKNHINPSIGNIRLQRLRSIDVQRMYNGLTESGLSAKSVKNVNTILSAALHKAIDMKLIPDNPCKTVVLPTILEKEIEPLSDSEIPLFINAIQGHLFENAYAVCLFAGLREGECLGLSWSQVDFDKQQITINQQLQKGKTKGTPYRIVPFTKSGKTRTIAPPPICFNYLKRQRQMQAQAKLSAGNLWANENDLVFTNEFGRHLSVDTFYAHFKRIAANIGRADLRPHDLRHTCGTVSMMNSNGNAKAVQSLLGHSTPSFTLARYVHATERMMKDTASRTQEYYESLGLNQRNNS